MNWAAIAAIGSFFGIIATIASVAYFSGQFTARLESNVAETRENKATLNEHRNMLDEHELQIDRLKEWRSGFNAAANISGGTMLQQGTHQ